MAANIEAKFCNNLRIAHHTNQQLVKLICNSYNFIILASLKNQSNLCYLQGIQSKPLCRSQDDWIRQDNKDKISRTLLNKLDVLKTSSFIYKSDPIEKWK